MSTKKSGSRTDVYARITERIVAELDKGVRPWVQPWAGGNSGKPVTRPLRHNGQPYTGMNVLILWSEGMARGFASTMWMTLRQANELGGRIRKGEEGASVVYASRFTKTDTDARGDEVERDIPFLKVYTVFNCEQIEGLPETYYQTPEPVVAPVVDAMERIEEADCFFANTGAMIRYGGTKAFYSPASDHIQMPPFETFRDAASYYAVLGHECVHLSGAKHRLDRQFGKRFGDEAYAFEELVADIGASFLCADLGIMPEMEPRPDHASYVASWLRVLDGDRKAVFQAAAHAQRAVAYLHGLQPQADTIEEAA